jgi:SARP family transcriptional regulator, regulator of embCAB operon
MPEDVGEFSRVQLCGTFAVELSGQRIDDSLPGRQGRLLFAYLVVSRLEPVPRDVLVDALWGHAAPANAGAALSALISKTRAVVGPHLLKGRSELSLTLPEPAQVDVELSLSMLHAAESAAALGDWRRAWSPSLSALFVARRRFLPEAEAAWADSWRRRLADVRVRALECYARTCLELGGTELPAAERAARELMEAAPFRESGHLLLMRTLAASGNIAEALAAYERLRIMLREELGVNPSPTVQDVYTRLLG